MKDEFESLTKSHVSVLRSWLDSIKFDASTRLTTAERGRSEQSQPNQCTARNILLSLEQHFFDTSLERSERKVRRATECSGLERVQSKRNSRLSHDSADFSIILLSLRLLCRPTEAENSYTSAARMHLHSNCHLCRFDDFVSLLHHLEALCLIDRDDKSCRTAPRGKCLDQRVPTSRHNEQNPKKSKHRVPATSRLNLDAAR
jgi:hypothetical protein